jgi:hypothetical protein
VLSQAAKALGKAKKITNSEVFLLLLARNRDFSGSSLRKHAARDLFEQIPVKRLIVEKPNPALQGDAFDTDIVELTLADGKSCFGLAPGQKPSWPDKPRIAEIDRYRTADRWDN